MASMRTFDVGATLRSHPSALHGVLCGRSPRWGPTLLLTALPKPLAALQVASWHLGTVHAAPGCQHQGSPPGSHVAEEGV